MFCTLHICHINSTEGMFTLESQIIRYYCSSLLSAKKKDKSRHLSTSVGKITDQFSAESKFT